MKVNKTFSIDYKLIHELKKKNNQSAFVSRAIWNSLDVSDKGKIVEATTRQLMAATHGRDDCDPFLKRVLLQQLSRTSPKKHTVSDKESLSS